MTPNESDRQEALDRIREVYHGRMANHREFHGETPARQRPCDLRRWAAYRSVLQRANLLPLGRRDILDVGCQTGTWLALCRSECGHQGGRLCGVDLMEEWVETGKRFHEDLDLRCGSGDELPWDDESFDLVHQGMVFSSVLDAALREGIAAEMRRVLRPGGFLLWYDFFFNPKNPDTIGMTLRRVRDCFPGWRIIHRRRVTLAPPLARVIERVSHRAVDGLTALGILNFHHLIVLQKESPEAPCAG